MPLIQLTCEIFEKYEKEEGQCQNKNGNNGKLNAFFISDSQGVFLHI